MPSPRAGRKTDTIVSHRHFTTTGRACVFVYRPARAAFTTNTRHAQNFVGSRATLRREGGPSYHGTAGWQQEMRVLGCARSPWFSGQTKCTRTHAHAAHTSPAKVKRYIVRVDAKSHDILHSRCRNFRLSQELGPVHMPAWAKAWLRTRRLRYRGRVNLPFSHEF